MADVNALLERTEKAHAEAKCDHGDRSYNGAYECVDLIPELVTALREAQSALFCRSGDVYSLQLDVKALRADRERLAAEREREAGLWGERHAHQHAVNTRLAAKNGQLAARCTELGDAIAKLEHHVNHETVMLEVHDAVVAENARYQKLVEAVSMLRARCDASGAFYKPSDVEPLIKEARAAVKEQTT